MSAPPPHLADRLEAALEHRADVEAEIARGAERRPSRRSLVRTLAWLGVTGISLYLVAPALVETLSAWRDVGAVDPWWWVPMLVLQAVSLACLWWLQRVATRRGAWFAIATSQLAGNGVAKIVPGGGAVGAAVQYRMLVQAGFDRPSAVAGLTATALLTLAIVLALPVLAVPALLHGAVDRSLVEAAIAGLAVFAVLFALGAVMLASDAPLRWVGRTAQRVRNRVRPHARAVEGLPARLVTERDRIVATVGDRWKAALGAAVGRWLLDYASLLAALAAVGSRPRPALVLLAFCAAQLLAQVPLTPGGVGFVEAGLTATLALAGVAPGDAVLATFAYRLVSYWLPIPLGVLGVVLHRRRYLRPRPAVAA